MVSLEYWYYVAGQLESTFDRLEQESVMDDCAKQETTHQAAVRVVRALEEKLGALATEIAGPMGQEKVNEATPTAPGLASDIQSACETIVQLAQDGEYSLQRMRESFQTFGL